jgi:hypothetical protein
MLVVEDALSTPAPEPMLQVTPAFEESFATVAVKACVPPPTSDAVDGLTVTLMEGGVGVGVDPPPLQPAKKANEVNAQKATRIPERTELFRGMGFSRRFVSYLFGNLRWLGKQCQ